jgi:large subunit ribosomal protein L37
MRITNVLFRQHIGFMTKRHWRIQGKRTPTDSGALAALEARGIKVTDTKEFLYPTPFKNREQ